MKNKLNIFLALALLVLTVFTFGCKAEVDLGGDAKKWNNLQSIGGNSQNLLQIKADGHDIDWWVITDEKNIVIEDYDVRVVASKDQEDGTKQTTIEKSGKILKGTLVELEFKFEKNTNVILWIGQDARVPKQAKDENGADLPAGSRDYRGRIPVGPNQGYVAVDNAYKEEVSPVGVVEVFCNETGSVPKGSSATINGKTCKGGNWNGDYTITEIWPLSQNGAAWEATEGLKFIFDEDKVINEGETVSVIYPAGNSVFALKQPSRFTEEDMTEGSNNYNSYVKQKDWYWCVRFEEGKLADGFLGEVPAHDIKRISSYDCVWHFDIVKNELTKSALGTTYIIDDADIVYAADEK